MNITDVPRTLVCWLITFELYRSLTLIHRETPRVQKW